MIRATLQLYCQTAEDAAAARTYLETSHPQLSLSPPREMPSGLRYRCEGVLHISPAGEGAPPTRPTSIGPRQAQTLLPLPNMDGVVEVVTVYADREETTSHQVTYPWDTRRPT